MAGPCKADKEKQILFNPKKMGQSGGDKAKDLKEKEKERTSKEQANRVSRERRLETRAVSHSLKDNDGLGAAAVAWLGQLLLHQSELRVRKVRTYRGSSSCW
jgi:hypothetical protein